VDTVIDSKYRLLRKLGVGGMGAVYEAEHAQVGRRVAVKLLHKIAIEGDTKSVSRLQREARLAGSLDSPHITQVLDVGIDPSTAAPYLVLEYLEGLDLEQTLRRTGRLPVSLALRVAAQMCLGLRRAHEAGIVHRDVKPANVFLAQREGDVVVKLLDFGIAKPTGEELAKLDQSALTTTGAMIGSPLYMSPEQARGLKTIDARADVWSTGVVLFTMLAGRTPNHDVTALGELILSICSVASPSVRDFAPETPMSVAEIVQRALAILPEHRYADAGELFQSLCCELDPSLKGSARLAIDLSELPVVGDAAAESRKLSPRVATGDPVRVEPRRDLTESGNRPVVVSMGTGAAASGLGSTEILPTPALGVSSPSDSSAVSAPSGTAAVPTSAARSDRRIPRPMLFGAVAAMLVGGGIGAVVIRPTGNAPSAPQATAEPTSADPGAPPPPTLPATNTNAPASASSPSAPSASMPSASMPSASTGSPTPPIVVASPAPKPQAASASIPTPTQTPTAPTSTATAAGTTSFGGRK
jgi:eukaryotic-like serine/threonine-protein kinase